LFLVGSLTLGSQQSTSVPGVDSEYIVVVLLLQLVGHGDHSLYSLLICIDICFYGLVLLGSGLYSRQVETEIVLQSVVISFEKEANDSPILYLFNVP